MGIKEETVESQMAKAMRILTDAVAERRDRAVTGARRIWARRK